MTTTIIITATIAFIIGYVLADVETFIYMKKGPKGLVRLFTKNKQ